jgi:hypothetical protein
VKDVPVIGANGQIQNAVDKRLKQPEDRHCACPPVSMFASTGDIIQLWERCGDADLSPCFGGF